MDDDLSDGTGTVGASEADRVDGVSPPSRPEPATLTDRVLAARVTRTRLPSTVASGLAAALIAVGGLALSGGQRLDAGPDLALLAAAPASGGAAVPPFPRVGRDAQGAAGLPGTGTGPAITPVPVSPSPDGRFLIAGGASAGGSGRLVRFTVEVEPEARVDAASVVDAVERALYDERSWSRDVRFERVGDPDLAQVRIIVARPTTVDDICGRAGARTEGSYSCWTGRIAALNVMRWRSGAPDFDDLDVYRTYLVNHEVGHALGHRHASCPARGDLAPVMVQQTKSTQGCLANGWPYP
jgi:hypothetical protein